MTSEGTVLIAVGTVKAISYKTQGKFSVCLVNGGGEAWYSAFGSPKFAKGDTLKIEFEESEDGRWKNAINIVVTEKAPPQTKLAPQLQSVKQENSMASYREAYIKDMVVALINNKENLTLEDATDVAVICFTKIVNAVKEFK